MIDLADGRHKPAYTREFLELSAAYLMRPNARELRAGAKPTPATPYVPVCQPKGDQ